MKLNNTIEKPPAALVSFCNTTTKDNNEKKLIICLLSVFTLPAYANGSAWALLTMAVCMEQDSTNKETTFGKEIMKQGAVYEASEARQYASCLAKNVTPMPDKLCKTLLNQTVESAAALDMQALYKAYEGDVSKLGDVKTCGM